MTLQHMMGRANIDLPDMVIECFKCGFSSKKEIDVDKHMTFSHLMGEKIKAGMEKYVALSTPNLLLSTLHMSSDDMFSEDSDSSELSRQSSKISGVRMLSENCLEAEKDVMENHDNTDLLNSPVSSRSNLISQVIKRRRLEDPILNADIVTKFPERNQMRRDTSSESIGVNPQLSPVVAESVQNFPEDGSNHRNISTDSIQLTPPPWAVIAENDDNCPEAETIQSDTLTRDIAESVQNFPEDRSNYRNISTDSIQLTPPPSAENDDNCPEAETIQRDTITRDIPRQVRSTSNALNVVNSKESNVILRTTSSGGTRNTPQRGAQKKKNAGMKNLVAGKKKISNIIDIGQFNTKYKANEKTKLLVKRHAKEASEHLLKLNNSNVEGLNNAENGFFIVFKSGGKTFVASEGNVGKSFVEDEEYRASLIEEAKVVDVQLNNTVLTSLLKSQYGTTKNQNTPKSHKRKNYNGIGAQRKKSKTSESKEKEPRLSKNKEKKKTTTQTVREDSSTDSDKSGGTIGSDILDESSNRYLESLIQEELEPRINSKAPKKQARQVYPYQCSECNSKYKTKNGYEKHLREKHGLN